jgi:hypothetical protein
MLFLLIVAACAYYFDAVPNKAVIVSREKPIRVPEPEQLRTVQLAKTQRIVYPYSVIRGGVRSREELAASISSDKVVADHFADFQISQAKIIQTEEAKFVHVSYRIRNKVYWTAKSIKLPKGETLITDGQEAARTRCGNMVSATPQEPTSEEEPEIETLDIPQLARVEAPELSDHEITPFQHPDIFYDYQPLYVPSANDIAVPEPGTLGLLATGLAILAAIGFGRQK